MTEQERSFYIDRAAKMLPYLTDQRVMYAYHFILGLTDKPTQEEDEPNE